MLSDNLALKCTFHTFVRTTFEIITASQLEPIDCLIILLQFNVDRLSNNFFYPDIGQRRRVEGRAKQPLAQSRPPGSSRAGDEVERHG